MNSDRNIESEMKKEIKNRENQDGDWEPWGPLDYPEDYGDLEFFADYLKRKGMYSSVEELSSARSAAQDFIRDTNLVDDITEFGTYEAERFAEWLVNSYGVEPVTADDYIGIFHKLANFYNSADYYAGNPFADVDKLADSKTGATSITGSNRVEVPLSTVRKSFANSGIKRFESVVVLTLIKTGMRISELCNLDVRDINIDCELWNDAYSVRTEIENKPDTIWISSDKTQQSIKSKNAGNKRKVNTPIPIDQELKEVLLWYTTVAPPAEDSTAPFFRGMKSDFGGRLGSNQASYMVIGWCKENGLHQDGNDQMDNVTAHRFRSLFTTHLYMGLESDEIGGFDVQKFVKGLRGDVGQDVIDDYINLYRDFREPIIRELPKIGLMD